MIINALQYSVFPGTVSDKMRNEEKSEDSKAMRTSTGYDSGAKTFTRIPTKHLSATIDGFTLQDQFMQTPKIPHSGNFPVMSVSSLPWQHRVRVLVRETERDYLFPLGRRSLNTCFLMAFDNALQPIGAQPSDLAL
uniref:CKK domain-containing protein n=1 Tax=Parascaris equorum TaxID=6256 RepID=A0A914R5J9_PAREQ